MRVKTRKSVKIGFSNERFLELLSDLTGIPPEGELGRETPLDFSSLEAARGSLLISEVFSKYDDGKPSEDKEKNTWKRFHEAEDQCQQTNHAIYMRGQLNTPFWRLVRARVHNALGRFDWDECARSFAFGPGSTTRLTKVRSAAAYKYSGIPETTPGNAVIARCAITHLPIWKQVVLYRGDDLCRDFVKVVPGNSVIAVPKNYKTDRTIAKEPDMNIYVQKGIGRAIRRRLYRIGVNLDDQTRNQRAAREGSLTGQLATIDLSMASDTVARELIHALLPADWCTALEQTRSPVGVLPSGEQIRYQKFSSMGNGYTFELESLIFWAIAQQCAVSNIWEKDSSICVYGDDIVVPTHCAADVCSRLAEAGFTPNAKKTWTDGPYRESCGKHYYSGIEITPFFIRKVVRSLDRLFLAHNNLYRWLERWEEGRGQTVEALTKLRSLAPAKWREPRLPDGFGDGAFIGPVDELRLDSHPHGWECWQVKALSRSQTELSDNLPDGQLVASLLASASARPIFRTPVKVGGKLMNLDLLEGTSGIPGRVGGYREINILIPRHPPAK
jgi:hypothetical protein